MGHKTQALHVHGLLVTIRSGFRRKVGDSNASVHDVFWQEDEPWVVLQLPSGRRTAVPASWTDLPSEHTKSEKNRAEAHPLALLELAKHCHNMRRSRPVGRTKGKKK
jgi:hypothetical protein